MATISHVREVYLRQPFHPFLIGLADGTTYVVKHHNFIAIPPGNLGMAAYFHTEGERPGEYTSHWIDLPNVVEIIAHAPAEPAHTPASTAEGNGA